MVKGHTATKLVLMPLLMALFVFFISAGYLGAQVQTATVTGTATDASGAVLGDAQIQATNTATNVSRTATTDAQGRYRITDLAVGTYTVKATHTGFQSVAHTNLTLSVGSTVTVDFSMPVGQATETVAVEANISRVETETSEISALIAPTQMQNLPLNGRDFTKLIALTPGVATVPSSTATSNFVTGRMYGASDNYSVAGSRPTGQAFLLDGTDIRNFWEHGTGSGYAGTSLGVEAIGEFQLLSSNYNAMFPGNGVVMNATSRAGSNAWHGGAYEYLRNGALNASTLSDRNSLLKNPDYKRAGLKKNQFGGAIGGPIKKDRAFFFANYEGLRERLQQTASTISMPMPYLYQGKLPCSQLSLGYLGAEGVACPSGATGAGNTATNPLRTVLPYGGSSATPLAITNLARMTDIMKLYQLCATCAPVANPTDLGGFYQTSATSQMNTNEHYLMGRFDYTLGAKDSIFARYTLDNAWLDDPRDPLNIFPATDHSRNQFLTITERRVMSTTMVNTAHLGWTRVKEQASVQAHLTDAQLSKVGLSYDPLNFTPSSWSDASMRQDGTAAAAVNLSVGMPSLGPDLNRPGQTIQSKFSFGDDLMWTKGNHSLALGIVLQRVLTNSYGVVYSSGGSPTLWAPNNNPNPGQIFGGELQGFFEGRPTFGFFSTPGNANSSRYFRETGVAPYVQDNWKILPRLTLNLGFRYDFFSNPTGWAAGNQSLTAITQSFNPPVGPIATAPDCSAFQSTLTNATLSDAQRSAAGISFAKCQLGIYEPVRHAFANNPNLKNFAPRVGFAYDPFGDHKTSIRGGFGIFHDPVAARIYQSGFTGTAPAGVFQINNFGANLFNANVTSGNPCFPNAFAIVNGYCGVTNPVPTAFAAVDYQAQEGSPYMMQYNLNIQRQLPGNTVLTVGYIGSVGRHMWMQRDTNTFKCSTYPNCSAIPTVSTPNTGACFTAACAGAGSTYVPQRINPNFGSRTQESATSASSYSGLQATLARQFSKSFSGQFNYTWSHCIDNGSFATSLEYFGQHMTQPYNQAYDYGNCNFDIRHNVSANGVFSLPFKGNRLVEGWSISTIVSFNTGMPVNVYNQSAQSDPSGTSPQWATRPNYCTAAAGCPTAQLALATKCAPNSMIGKWVNTNVDRNGNSLGAPYWAYQWFDANCYTPQASGYVGNVIRNSIDSPNYFNADLSLSKSTKLTEKLNMVFRAEFFNVLNHYNPAPPASALGSKLGDPGVTVPTGFSAGQAGLPRQIQFAVKFDF